MAFARPPTAKVACFSFQTLLFARVTKKFNMYFSRYIFIVWEGIRFLIQFLKGQFSKGIKIVLGDDSQ